MPFKSRVHFVILIIFGFVAELFFLGYLVAKPHAGNLVAVNWFDRFGIERMAVDRGLLEYRDELMGVFVVLLDGEAV